MPAGRPAYKQASKPPACRASISCSILSLCLCFWTACWLMRNAEQAAPCCACRMGRLLLLLAWCCSTRHRQAGARPAPSSIRLQGTTWVRAAHSSALRCAVPQYATRLYTALPALHCVPPLCAALRRTVPYCSTLHHCTTLHCTVPHWPALLLSGLPLSLLPPCPPACLPVHTPTVLSLGSQPTFLPACPPARLRCSIGAEQHAAWGHTGGGACISHRPLVRPAEPQALPACLPAACLPHHPLLPHPLLHHPFAQPPACWPAHLPALQVPGSAQRLVAHAHSEVDGR